MKLIDKQTLTYENKMKIKFNRFSIREANKLNSEISRLIGSCRRIDQTLSERHNCKIQIVELKVYRSSYSQKTIKFSVRAIHRLDSTPKEQNQKTLEDSIKHQVRDTLMSWINKTGSSPLQTDNRGRPRDSILREQIKQQKANERLIEGNKLTLTNPTSASDSELLGCERLVKELKDTLEKLKTTRKIKPPVKDKEQAHNFVKREIYLQQLGEKAAEIATWVRRCKDCQG